MKHFLLIALTAFSVAHAETWTSKEGREAHITLVKVEEVDGEKVGTFRLPGGQTTQIKASDLSKQDAKRLNEWKGSDDDSAAASTGPESVFDIILDGNLVRLDGRSLKRCKDATQPKKYYVFYYTASWCGPCQQFTPELVDFYKDNKNDNFELVLITSDQDDDAMEDYAKDKKMPWPQLKLSKTEKFKKEFKHGVTGIPSVIVCELDGKKLGNYRSNLKGLKKLIAE